MKRILTIAVLGLLAPVFPAKAAVYSYRGTLLDGGGVPLKKGITTLEVSLFDVEKDGSPLWQRKITVSLDAAGRFATELSEAVGSAVPGGPTAPIGEVVANSAGRPLYIQVTVKGSVDTTLPRARLGAVPAAVCAESVLEAPQNLDVKGKFESVGGVTCNGAATVGFDAVAHADMTVRGTCEVARVLAVVKGGATVRKDLLVRGGAAAQEAVLKPALAVSREVTTARLEVETSDFTIGGVNAYISPGSIVIWPSSDPVPNGWAECNGQSYVGSDKKTYTTPDLTGRFIVGADGDAGTTYAIGKRGGERAVALNATQVANHRHQLSFTFCGPRWTGSDKEERLGGISLKTQRWYEGLSDKGKKDFPKGTWKTATQKNSGEGVTPHNNLPPYLAVRYIVKKF